jgi:hypothetical protein
MNKKKFVTIYGTYGNLNTVRQTLPSVIKETITTPNSALIIHDSTEEHHGRSEKWNYLKKLEVEYPIFLILSTNLSMAHARNMCLSLSQELYCPDNIGMMEDDYGYKPGFITSMNKAIKIYYGEIAPNGLRFGLFTGSSFDDNIEEKILPLTNHSYRPIQEKSPNNRVGGTNSSFRCAPSHHWTNVLKGYDTDEYLISEYQTNGLNLRNYNKGYTVLNVENNSLMFKINTEGRGVSIGTKTRMYDPKYTAKDYRSHHLSKMSKIEIEEEKNGIYNKLKTVKRKLFD